MNLNHALESLTQKLRSENSPEWNQIQCFDLTAEVFHRSFSAPQAPKMYTILQSELFSSQEFSPHFDKIKKIYTWFHIEALGVNEGTLVVMFEHARERVQSESARKVLEEKGPQVRYVTVADYGSPAPSFQIIDG